MIETTRALPMNRDSREKIRTHGCRKFVKLTQHTHTHTCAHTYKKRYTCGKIREHSYTHTDTKSHTPTQTLMYTYVPIETVFSSLVRGIFSRGDYESEMWIFQLTILWEWWCCIETLIRGAKKNDTKMRKKNVINTERSTTARNLWDADAWGLALAP